MKLDHDVVRDLLLTIEREQQSPDWEMQIGNSDYPRFYAAYTIWEMGLISALMIPGSDGDEAIVISRMTGAGHRFLDDVRDPTAWETAKTQAGKIGGWSLELLAALAKEAIKAKARELGLPI